MKNIRAAVALFLLAVFLAGTASANTSSINPNVPAQNSPLSSSVLRGNFGNAYTDENTIYGIFALSSNQLLGTINAGNAGPLNLPTCSTGALSWTPGTGFGCNSLSGLVSPITQSLVFTGQIGISLNATALPTKQTGTVLQLGNADGVASRIENDAFASTAYFTGVRSDGTNAAPTTLQNLDEISGINAWGYNGSSVVGPRASVREFAAQNWTGSAQGTRVDIATTLNNTTTMSPVCGFENDGGVTCPPTVTGGDMGAGRINAAGLFVNGVAVSTGNSAISALTAALATSSIENGAFAQVWNWDGLTTQTALQLTGTSITTGQLLNSSVANAASTGYAGYFSNTGTAASYALYSTDASTGAGYGLYSGVTGAANTGYGVYGTNAGAANLGYAGYFSNTATTAGYGVYGASASTGAGYGVYGAVTGAANTGYAGYFSNTSTATGYALYVSGSAYFSQTTTMNNVTVTGTCTGCGGGTLIGATTTVNTSLGSGAMTSVTTGATNAAFGYNALHLATVTTGNTAVGSGALALTVTAGGNTAVGINALSNLVGGGNGMANTAVGASAMSGAMTTAATQNTGLGASSCGVTSGTQNTCVGDGAGSGLNGGSQNVIAGIFAASSYQGSGAVIIGSAATSGSNANSPTVVGSNATAANGGVAVGNSAGGTATGNNTSVGQGAGAALTSGTGNIAIGSFAGGTVSTGSNNISLNASPPASGTSNWLNIGSGVMETLAAPTISSGFGTSPSVANGTSSASFTVNVGTGGTATSGVIAFPTAAPHGWNCHAVDNTDVGTIETECVTTSTTTATCTSYSRTAGTALAWSASDILGFTCAAY